MAQTVIRLCGGTDPFGYLIAAALMSPICHVDFLIPNNRLLGAVRRGVRIEDYRSAPIEEFYTVEVPEGTTGYEYALTQIGKPYDWEAVLGLFFQNRDWRCEDSWFCSELVAFSLSKIGVDLVRGEHDRITPRDIRVSPYLKPISKEDALRLTL